VPDPAPSGPGFLAQAEARSPELQAARLGVEQARRNVDLARLEQHPDFSVSAGVMPRAPLEPMWTASVGITLPLWSRNKQHRAVAEQEYRSTAAGWDVERLRCLLEQRVRERDSDLEADLQVIRLYRAGLLVQSEGTFRATLAQYMVGKVPFLAVLEALDGWVSDQGGLVQAQAQAQAAQIAQQELNLGATPAIASSALPAAGAMGGAGTAPRPAPARSGGAPAGGGDNSSSMSSGM
jgi:cobalt-zinc-cadmium efflux system outer membrane protein